MIKALIPAVVVGLMAATSANAAPVSTVGGLERASGPGLVQTVAVKKKVVKKVVKKPVVKKKKFVYVPGNHYSKAPTHWHRYKSRPRAWKTWGCIVVGPFWYCT